MGLVKGMHFSQSKNALLLNFYYFCNFAAFVNIFVVNFFVSLLCSQSCLYGGGGLLYSTGPILTSGTIPLWKLFIPLHKLTHVSILNSKSN